MGWRYGEIRKYRENGTVPDHMAVVIGKERFATLKELNSAALGASGVQGDREGDLRKAGQEHRGREAAPGRSERSPTFPSTRS